MEINRRRLVVAAACTALMAPSAGRAQAVDVDGWPVNPLRGPVDLGLTDRVLNGAIDIHVHLDPDGPGAFSAERALDVFEAADIAIARGMRGMVVKAHQDMGGANAAYMIRRHKDPTFQAFGRMPANLSTGGINAATLEHFTQIRGGWGRIFEMPTVDGQYQKDPVTREPQDVSTWDRERLARIRPWVKLLAPDALAYVPLTKNGELLPEVKRVIGLMPDMRTVDSGGRVVLATGHALPEEHVLVAREGRRVGLSVLITHPGDIPQLPELAKLGAYIEMTAALVARTAASKAAAAAVIKKIGAEHIIMGTDCGTRTNPYPTDCMVMAARGLRANGITERELDLMYKVNPAKLLGLEPPENIATK
jgi:hypothetical protein